MEKVTISGWQGPEECLQFLPLLSDNERCGDVYYAMMYISVVDSRQRRVDYDDSLGFVPCSNLSNPREL